jgi:hypothetical protein
VALAASIRLDRCQYCNRPGFVVWDDDLFTCGREVCKSLAFAEVRRRHHDGSRQAAPEQKLARALLSAFDTFAYAVGLDEKGEVLSAKEADTIRSRERERTARLLAEIHSLGRRYPAPPPEAGEPAPVQPPSPRYRRFVSRGRTVPFRNPVPIS